MKRLVIAMTGASGAPLAHRLIGELVARDCEVHITTSRAGRVVIEQELEATDPPRSGSRLFPEFDTVREWSERDFSAPFASGSARFDGMVVVPCSMSTVAALASGLSDNLLRRAADVMLKEHRRLIVVPRECPLSSIHLENLARLANAGARVIPPVLTFYQKPSRDVADQIDFVVSRILDHLGIDNDLFPRWSD